MSVVITSPLIAADNDATNAPAKAKPDFPPHTEVLKDFEQVISSIDKVPSLLDIYVRRKDNQMLAVFPRNFERKKFFIALTVASGERYAGLQAGDMYVYWKRTSPHPMMTLFDAPSRESSCVRRSRTNTPLQSLGLLNETQRVEMARSLGQRLLQSKESDAERLDLLFTLAASRQPTERERSVCSNLLAQMKSRYVAKPDDAARLLSIGDAPRNQELDPAELAAWTQLSNTILASDLAIMMY